MDRVIGIARLEVKVFMIFFTTGDMLLSGNSNQFSLGIKSDRGIVTSFFKKRCGNMNLIRLCHLANKLSSGTSGDILHIRGGIDVTTCAEIRA
ncbi:Uncharacterised protein [Legionella pneumophila]|nr:Uncharacterised protein [Legionella pneumophila]